MTDKSTKLIGRKKDTRYKITIIDNSDSTELLRKISFQISIGLNGADLENVVNFKMTMPNNFDVLVEAHIINNTFVNLESKTGRSELSNVLTLTENLNHMVHTFKTDSYTEIVEQLRFMFDNFCDRTDVRFSQAKIGGTHLSDGDYVGGDLIMGNITQISSVSGSVQSVGPIHTGRKSKRIIIEEENF